jgi:hypothetical protein
MKRLFTRPSTFLIFLSFLLVAASACNATPNRATPEKFPQETPIEKDITAVATSDGTPQETVIEKDSTVVAIPHNYPQEITIEKDITYGPGNFQYPDPLAGLSVLSSYKATLSLTFEGTRDGKPMACFPRLIHSQNNGKSRKAEIFPILNRSS